MALYAEKLALRGNFVKFWFINGGDSMITNVQNVSYESFPISMTQFKPNEIFYKVDKFLQKIHPVFNVRLVWAVNESLFSCYRLYFWHRYRLLKDHLFRNS